MLDTEEEVVPASPILSSGRRRRGARRHERLRSGRRSSRGPHPAPTLCPASPHLKPPPSPISRPSLSHSCQDQVEGSTVSTRCPLDHFNTRAQNAQTTAPAMVAGGAVKTLFPVGEVEQMGEVLTVRRADLQEVGSSSEEEREDEVERRQAISAQHIKTNILQLDKNANKAKTNGPTAGLVKEKFSIDRKQELVDSVESAQKKMASSIVSLSKNNFSMETETEKTGKNFYGFKTGTGKANAISDEALKKVKDKDLGHHSTTTFHEEEILKDKKDIPEESETGGGKEPFGGFKSAAGKTIRVSDEAIQKVKAKFGEFNENSTKEKITMKPDLSDYGNEPVEKPGIVSVSNHEEERFVGFKSAAGKTIEVSDEAIRKARRTFKDFDDESAGVTKSFEKSPSIGLTSAAGNKIHVSKEALAKVKGLHTDLQTHNEEKDKSKFTNTKKKSEGFSGGFMTARGNKIDISEEALRESKRKFDEKEKMFLSTKPSSLKSLQGKEEVRAGEGGFSTVAGAQITVSRQALQTARAKLEAWTRPAPPAQPGAAAVTDSWGDSEEIDEDLMKICDDSERKHLEKQEEVYTCHPLEVKQNSCVPHYRLTCSDGDAGLSLPRRPRAPAGRGAAGVHSPRSCRRHQGPA